VFFQEVFVLCFESVDFVTLFFDCAFSDVKIVDDDAAWAVTSFVTDFVVIVGAEVHKEKADF
jgi:hypothetical protein